MRAQQCDFSVALITRLTQVLLWLNHRQWRYTEWRLRMEQCHDWRRVRSENVNSGWRRALRKRSHRHRRLCTGQTGRSVVKVVFFIRVLPIFIWCRCLLQAAQYCASVPDNPFSVVMLNAAHPRPLRASFPAPPPSHPSPPLFNPHIRLLFSLHVCTTFTYFRSRSQIRPDTSPTFSVHLVPYFVTLCDSAHPFQHPHFRQSHECKVKGKFIPQTVCLR